MPFASNRPHLAWVIVMPPLVMAAVKSQFIDLVLHVN